MLRRRATWILYAEMGHRSSGIVMIFLFSTGQFMVIIPISPHASPDYTSAGDSGSSTVTDSPFHGKVREVQKRAGPL